MDSKVKVKVCGITNQEDALKAVYYGAWALGFIFYKDSPRAISPSRVRKIVEQLPPFVTAVGVFVNQKEGAIRDICQFTRIHTIQLHGDEDPHFCKRLQDYKIIKAFRVKNRFDPSNLSAYKVDAYLLDTFEENSLGGTGQIFNWELIKDIKFNKPFILAGGLTSKNIPEALKILSPYAVDVSSGVEKSPGVKDGRLLKELFDSLKCY